MIARGGVALALMGSAVAQKPGSLSPEFHPKLNLYTCTKAGGCWKEGLEVVLDASWRWVHGPEYKNCFDSKGWSKEFCSDPVSCAATCELEGLAEKDYTDTYGIKSNDGGDTLELDFMTPGGNVGSRVYMMQSPEEYKLFHLLNREFTMDVSVEELHCGMNGAVYFIEMDRMGGKGKGNNQAGAKYGTGYCDGQCPHMKWIEGEANLLDWNATTGIGKYGICCGEMDIWEANRESTAYTPHPCKIEGPVKCSGTDCGDGDERFKGLCDKDGCDYNHYRMGTPSYYGNGKDFAVDSSKPLTVVTQFHTLDGTDRTPLARIERFYVQDGKVIENSRSMVPGVPGNALTDGFCAAQKSIFGDPDDFTAKGGMAQMGGALERGMVLSLSLWDDFSTNMQWLDGTQLGDKSPRHPGVHRGPCGPEEGTPKNVRSKYSDSSVRYSKIAIGEIGSTFGHARRLDGVYV